MIRHIAKIIRRGSKSAILVLLAGLLLATVVPVREAQAAVDVSAAPTTRWIEYVAGEPFIVGGTDEGAGSGSVMTIVPPGPAVAPPPAAPDATPPWQQ